MPISVRTGTSPNLSNCYYIGQIWHEGESVAFGRVSRACLHQVFGIFKVSSSCEFAKQAKTLVCIYHRNCVRIVSTSDKLHSIAFPQFDITYSECIIKYCAFGFDITHICLAGRTLSVCVELPLKERGCAFRRWLLLIEWARLEFVIDCSIYVKHL